MNIRRRLRKNDHRNHEIRRRPGRSPGLRRRLSLQGLEDRRLLAVLSNGGGPGDVTIEVNAQGAFGVSSGLLLTSPSDPTFLPPGDPGGARFVPPNQASPGDSLNAVFESGLAIGFLSGFREFLTAGTIGGTGDNLNGFFVPTSVDAPQTETHLRSQFFWPNDVSSSAPSSGIPPSIPSSGIPPSIPSSGFPPSSPSSGVSSPVVPSNIPFGAELAFQLDQRLVDLWTAGQQDGTALVQDYRVTNVSSSLLSFELVRYFDGDLFENGNGNSFLTPTFDGGGAGIANSSTGAVTVFQTDADTLFQSNGGGVVVNDPTFVGVQVSSPDASGRERWEVGEFSDLLGQIEGGLPLRSAVTLPSADLDNNGIIDPETGGDVAVALSQEFLNVAPGDTVVFTTLTVFGHPPARFAPPPIENFGTVEGVKFSDDDGDGVFGSNEFGLEGFQIFADLNENGVLDAGEPSTFTGPSGLYSLDLSPGAYEIREVIPPGWSQTAPSVGFHSVVVQGGGFVSGIDFGNFPLVSEISGVKFEDDNANGLRDSFEFGLSGVTIYLDENDNGVLDANEPQTATDSFGDYFFTDLAPGSYVVREVPPSGMVQTFPGGDGSHRVTLAAGETRSGLDFGNAFPPQNVVGVGDGPVDVKFADVTGDGLGDILTANLNSGDVSVVEGLGNGTFAPSFELSTTSGPVAVVAADIDGVNGLDLVVAHDGVSQVALLLPATGGQPMIGVNDGDTFTIDHDGAGANTATLFEFDADGVLNDPAAQQVPYSFNDDQDALADNTATAINAAALPGVAAVHVGGGKVRLNSDVATIDTSGSPNVSQQNLFEIAVLLNDGTGGFLSPLFFDASGPQSDIDILDFDADGDIDVAVTLPSTNEAAILENISSISVDFAGPLTYSVGSFPLAVRAGDFDGDGLPDLAVANSGSNDVSILRNVGGDFAPEVSVSVGLSPMDLAIADVNDDGTSDIAVANSGSQSITVIYNNVFPTTATFSTPGDPVAITAGFLDGDQFVDLAVALEANNTYAVLLNDGFGGFPASDEFPAGNEPFAIFADAIDADGFDDLLVANFADDTVSVELSGGFDPGAGEGEAISEDLDGNGRVDAFDLLVLVNEIRDSNESQLAASGEETASRYDLSGDGLVAPDDLLRVVRYIRDHRYESLLPEGELEETAELPTAMHDAALLLLLEDDDPWAR